MTAPRTAILSPLSEFGEAAAQAARAVGAEVVTGNWDGNPAKVLAFLERSEATEAVLPVSVVRVLPTHPAAPMTDLSALRRIVCEGPLTEAETAAVLDAFGVEAVGQVTRDVTDVARLVREAAQAADDELAGIDLDEAVAAIERFGQTALLSMLNALCRNGFFVSPGQSHTVDEILDEVAAEHRLLIRRWLEVLTAQGLLVRLGDRFRAVAVDYSDAALADSWTEAERAWRATAGSAVTIDYARRNADRLPELMRGTEQAVLLLFPEGRTDLARALYRENVTGRYQRRAVSAFVGGLASAANSPLRILEVGAGTGATTELLLPAVTGHDYVYTDVSKYFLDQAREHFAADDLSFGLFDIDVDLEDQAFTPDSFDIVVGGGVLNAAQDTDASLRRLTELLRPGGWLVLTEPTVEEFWIMTSQAFMMAGARDDRSESGSTFLSLPQWNSALEAAGLERVLGLPAAGHPLDRLGHRVFAARAGR